jgi:hypothetical protein
MSWRAHAAMLSLTFAASEKAPPLTGAGAFFCFGVFVCREQSVDFRVIVEKLSDWGRQRLSIATRYCRLDHEIPLWIKAGPRSTSTGHIQQSTG